MIALRLLRLCDVFVNTRWRRRSIVVTLYTMIAINVLIILRLPPPWLSLSFFASACTVFAIFALTRVRANGGACLRDERDEELRSFATVIAYRASIAGLGIIVGVAMLARVFVSEDTAYGIVAVSVIALFMIVGTLPNAIIAWHDIEPPALVSL